jgi:hypothetical protein
MRKLRFSNLSFSNSIQIEYFNWSRGLMIACTSDQAAIEKDKALLDGRDIDGRLGVRVPRLRSNGK